MVIASSILYYGWWSTRTKGSKELTVYLYLAGVIRGDNRSNY